jgi:CRISPR/Cas system-associated protein Cas5 (RAMP superfamily)
LLFFKTDNPFLLILATALIGALVAGFAALTASFVRRSELK